MNRAGFLRGVLGLAGAAVVGKVVTDDSEPVEVTETEVRNRVGDYENVVITRRYADLIWQPEGQGWYTYVIPAVEVDQNFAIDGRGTKMFINRI